jgi:hypothetical protein
MSTYLGSCNYILNSWQHEMHLRCKQQIQSYIAATCFGVTYVIERQLYSTI